MFDITRSFDDLLLYAGGDVHNNSNGGRAPLAVVPLHSLFFKTEPTEVSRKREKLILKRVDFFEELRDCQQKAKESFDAGDINAAITAYSKVVKLLEIKVKDEKGLQVRNKEHGYDSTAFLEFFEDALANYQEKLSICYQADNEQDLKAEVEEKEEMPEVQINSELSIGFGSYELIDLTESTLRQRFTISDGDKTQDSDDDGCQFVYYSKDL